MTTSAGRDRFHPQLGDSSESGLANRVAPSGADSGRVIVVEPGGGPVTIHWQCPNGEPTMTQTITYESVLLQLRPIDPVDVIQVAMDCCSNSAEGFATKRRIVRKLRDYFTATE